jgi:hypothetical protein
MDEPFNFAERNSCYLDLRNIANTEIPCVEKNTGLLKVM